jgi:hypothetical protein
MFAVQRFDRIADPLMERPSASYQDRPGSHLLGQRMLEDIFGVAQRRLLVDELAQLQVIEQAVEFIIGFRDV